MDLDLQGSIERFTLPEIFQLIAAGRKSGTLGIQKDDSIVMVYFKEGDIVYGYGPRQTFHLGQLLRDRGVITSGQLEEAIGIQARTENSKRLGEILIERRFIDRADLESVVRQQIEELLYSLLSWETGSFKFYENQFPTDEEITVRISVENVILEGLRRVDEANMVRQTLPNSEAVMTISASQSGRSRDVSLEAAEWNILALVDGHRSLNQICQNSPFDEQTTMSKLAQLKLAGLITQTERKPTTSSDQLEQMIDRLAGLFESYLTEKTAGRSATSSRRISETILENRQ
ncbi:DUF4388 domain-containing protein [candidate division GN15 bacterium]|nr:DUF4388 domain-containing protein [candidate division GN15 bacterium]